jgi:predicted regulator of Ras-like GTPase activity (Roadblock/LC7/MglB family)
MASEKELTQTIERIEREIPGFIAASLVDLDSGMTLAVKSLRADFDLTAASAYNSEMVKTKLKIMRTLGLGGTLEDMLLTLTDQIHLIKLLTPATFLYIAVDKSQCNLAIVRTVVNRNAASLT